MEVFAGILVHTKEDLESRIREIDSIPDGIHIDVADNEYVPNKLLDLSEIDLLPSLFCEAHLMVLNPQDYFDDCKRLGFKRLIVHFDAMAEKSYDEALLMQDQIHKLGMEFCLGFRDTDIIELNEELRKLDSILVMTIEIGFSGQPFEESQLEKIRRVREYDPRLIIAVDGHVDDTTVNKLRQAGVNRIVSTTYLSGSNIKSKFTTLKNG